MRIPGLTLRILAGIAALLLGVTYVQAADTPVTRPATTIGATSSTNSTATGNLDLYAGKKFTRGLKTEKKIALTFDDGPHPKYTPQVLKILKEENVTATFFWLGSMVKNNPETAQMVTDGGYEIGTHSWDHPKLQGRTTEFVRKQILDTQDLVQQMTGKRPRLFRPPYGATGVAVNEICKQDGLVICLWTVDTLDWNQRRPTEKVVDAAIHETGNGSVILMHDIQPRTVAHLSEIIHGLKERGFTFVTMGELIAEKAAHPEAEAENGEGDAAVPTGPTVIPLNKSKAR